MNIAAESDSGKHYEKITPGVTAHVSTGCVSISRAKGAWRTLKCFSQVDTVESRLIAARMRMQRQVIYAAQIALGNAAAVSRWEEEGVVCLAELAKALNLYLQVK